MAKKETGSAFAFHFEDTPEAIARDVKRHIATTLGNDPDRAGAFLHYMGLAYSVRDRLIQRWIETQRYSYDEKLKRVYYLSLEYLPGKSLMNNLLCLGITETARAAMASLDFDLTDIAELEWDAGLGNGGLGRLASCFLDSMASLDVPAYGYGIRYDYGIFLQRIVNNRQVEVPDNWMQRGNPWEFTRPLNTYEVTFYGEVQQVTEPDGWVAHKIVGGETVLAMPCDMFVPGYLNNRCLSMRLWSASSSSEFKLDYFQHGNYIRAVEDKVSSENLTKVLYPSDSAEAGRELRLKQQYFFVSASLCDMLRRFKKKHTDFRELPNTAAVQMNDTHPAIAVAEMMRLLVDQERQDWETAWEVTQKTLAYTNHTILPEALETWAEPLLANLLPRQAQIIREIDRRFMERLEVQLWSNPRKDEIKANCSIYGPGYDQTVNVRMANLAILGSHAVNGVSAMHSELLKERVFRDFFTLFPERFQNKTNGVTPRRWLMLANPDLGKLLTEKIGKGVACDLEQLKELENLAEDKTFQAAWQAAKLACKERFSDYLKRRTGKQLTTSMLFDVQTKRIHEYKRQLMNVLHLVTLYNRMRKNPDYQTAPRAVFFGGKAAPGYWMAKQIIRLICDVSETVNRDPAVKGRLEGHFLYNYCVSQAERVVPAADLSEQISMAGMEASGTGNMKFAINGALTIGTWDGANVEMAQHIGPENMFLFGMKEVDINELNCSCYNPWSYYQEDAELREALDMIRGGFFSPNDKDRYVPVFDALTQQGDTYKVLADYRAYVDTQDAVGALYQNQEEWTRRSILNTARMGFFSSDRSIREYVKDIWGVTAFDGCGLLSGPDDELLAKKAKKKKK